MVPVWPSDGVWLGGLGSSSRPVSSGSLRTPGLTPALPGGFGCWQREASITMLSLSTTNFPCKETRPLEQMSLLLAGLCPPATIPPAGLKWDKAEQLRDKKENLTVDVCYLKVKAPRSLYGSKGNRDLHLKNGFRQGPGAEHPDERAAA